MCVRIFEFDALSDNFFSCYQNVMLKEVSLREFSKIKGVTLSTVQKAIATGRIKLNENGKINTEEALRNWIENTNDSKRTHGGGVEFPVEYDPEEREKINDVVEVREDYLVSRAKREQYAASLAKLEYEKEAALLVSAEKVSLETFKAGRVLRDSLFSIPDRIAAQLAAENDVDKVHEKLTTEISNCLTDLANSFKKLIENSKDE